MKNQRINQLEFLKCDKNGFWIFKTMCPSPPPEFQKGEFLQFNPPEKTHLALFQNSLPIKMNRATWDKFRRIPIETASSFTHFFTLGEKKNKNPGPLRFEFRREADFLWVDCDSLGTQVEGELSFKMGKTGRQTGGFDGLFSTLTRNYFQEFLDIPNVRPLHIFNQPLITRVPIKVQWNKILPSLNSSLKKPISILLSSPLGARLFLKSPLGRCFKKGTDFVGRAMGPFHFYFIGEKVLEVFKQLNLDLEVKRMAPSLESMANSLNLFRGETLLHLGAQEGLDHPLLKEKWGRIIKIPLYQTQPSQKIFDLSRPLSRGLFQWILLSSPSNGEIFFNHWLEILKKGFGELKFLSLGNSTAKTINDWGFKCIHPPNKPGIGEILKKLFSLIASP